MAFFPKTVLMSYMISISLSGVIYFSLDRIFFKDLFQIECDSHISKVSKTYIIMELSRRGVAEAFWKNMFQSNCNERGLISGPQVHE